MARKRYYFNTDTLRYEVRQISLGRRVLRSSATFVGVAALGLCLMMVFTTIFDTPRAHALRRKQQDYRLQFAMLSDQAAAAERRLAIVEARDNNLYRTIFEADTIPRTIREGGVGGVDHYAEYSRMGNGAFLASLAESLDRLNWRAYVQSKSFDEVAALAHKKDQMMHSVPAVQPVSVKQLARISSYFGVRTDPFTKLGRLHSGLDFVAPVGTPIHATGDGLVLESEYRANGYGKQVVIDHGFGYKTRYAHMSKLIVEVGQKVKRGQVLGLIGSTGRSTGTHLHYEVLLRNRPVNPILYFSEMDEAEYEQMLANAQIQALD